MPNPSKAPRRRTSRPKPLEISDRHIAISSRDTKAEADRVARDIRSKKGGRARVMKETNPFGGDTGYLILYKVGETNAQSK